jgi:hypothetical protein
MQQRQPRLGDILDDYCPRERRVTNHAVVAMVGAEVRQTRCTTCDAEHGYKHARVPRQRLKAAAAAAPGGPAAPVHARRAPEVADAGGVGRESPVSSGSPLEAPLPGPPLAAEAARDEGGGGERHDEDFESGDAGPVHRRLIRATLPRIEGQPPPSRPPSEFTIRQPTGRGQHFRARHQRMDQPFHGFRPNGGGNAARGGPRQNAGRGVPQRPANRRGQGRRRPK